ncbi:unnamed protein product [Cylindrotheca closterium]|uniref:Uncharacterized protein n=1 Tax=Cylindrotheca closterium TaxID=2856 RepID=A0AAD2G977_9STRA|nr:unnamed protein product [Cylindrotheca closterium]
MAETRPRRQPSYDQHDDNEPDEFYRRRRRGILKPTRHSSRRFVPSSWAIWGVPIPVKTLLLGMVQMLLPVSMCWMGYTVEKLTFGDWILRVLVIFTLTLVSLLLLVDSTLSPSSAYQKSGCRIMITPAESKESVVPSSKAILSKNSSYQKIVSFAKGTKFFRLPRPKSKRQLLREKQELHQQQQQEQSQQSGNRSQTPIKFPTLAGMTPPPPRFASNEIDSTPDWKRAHRLLRQAMRDDPPAHKHDEREDLSSEGRQLDVRDEAQSAISKHLFGDNKSGSDGFDADSERDDDDTGDNLSVQGSMVERDDMEDLISESSSKLSKRTRSTILALEDDEDSMILFEDDDDTYEDTIMLGTHTCYSPLRASESEDTLEEELEEALVETIEQLSPNRLCI